MIPGNIEHHHVVAALDQIDRTGLPSERRRSRKYCLVHQQRHYPPKYVLSLANQFANGAILSPGVFNGGPETNAFLQARGFRIVLCSCGGVLRQASGNHLATSKAALVSATHTGERCPECKQVIERMLERLFGACYRDWRPPWSPHLSDYYGTELEEPLQKIFAALESARGQAGFVKTGIFPQCDYYVPEPGFIVEFDESQHFTPLRKITLDLYPLDAPLGFSINKWRNLCQRINARDPSPEYRDEQRAWYDTLRDLVPPARGLTPTIRIFAKDFRWCSLDPENSSDVAIFGRMLKSRNRRVVVEARQTPEASLGRVIIVGDWTGDVEAARTLLQEVCHKWPSGHRVKCLITGGGFLNFPWPNSLEDVGDVRNPKPEALLSLRNEAEKLCRLLLSDGLRQEMLRCTDYLTIGVDSAKSRISLAGVFISQLHAELVTLIDLRTDSHLWTGKSYPTSSQEKGLVRISDLSTHFFDLDFGKAMILGCHDLTMFNNRNWEKTAGWRKEIKVQFRELARRKKPTVVLQHPHTTDSTRTWAAAWARLMKELPSVTAYASAGRYYRDDGERSTLDEVLRTTKSGPTIDVVVDTNGKVVWGAPTPGMSGDIALNTT